MKDLYTSCWTPKEDPVKFKIFWNERTCFDHNLRLFTTGPDDIEVIERWVMYLSDLFNASLNKLHLNSEYFGIEENKRIINAFGTEGSMTTFVLEHGDVKGEEDEELIQQTFDINSMKIELLESSFANNEFKIIMNKWKNGWNPNWSSMKIEFSETLDVEDFVNENLFENEV
ncbi:hypothetical protein CRE_10845 [Caenorhabditis remanei]|uniref:F-box associated domain-containing protein n=1 Tax=Caenorhabditis remanei TaxID=31234 RepID=E3M553_CAERE|nr:hypothetical protein CRE_10845 [Caenorhabditis remanei]